jgi:hypothetical protein
MGPGAVWPRLLFVMFFGGRVLLWSLQAFSFLCGGLND